MLDVNLVTDSDDDDGYSAVGPEDSDWDTTHLASLGATARVEVHVGMSNPIVAEIPVMRPVGGIEVVVSVLSQNGSLSPAELTDVMRDCFVARALHAQIGVDVTAINVAGMPMDPLIASLIADGDLSSHGALTDDLHLLCNTLPATNGTGKVLVYYVRTTIGGGGIAGVTTNLADAYSGGSVVISLADRTPLTLAHEIGHALALPHNTNATHLLMRGSGTIHNHSHLDSKRFTLNEEGQIKMNRRFYVPAP